jgi:hypothetical protein
MDFPGDEINTVQQADRPMALVFIRYHTAISTADFFPLTTSISHSSIGKAGCVDEDAIISPYWRRQRERPLRGRDFGNIVHS